MLMPTGGMVHLGLQGHQGFDRHAAMPAKAGLVEQCLVHHVLHCKQQTINVQSMCNTSVPTVVASAVAPLPVASLLQSWLFNVATQGQRLTKIDVQLKEQCIQHEPPEGTVQ